jgi:hypothetical protein
MESGLIGLLGSNTICEAWGWRNKEDDWICDEEVYERERDIVILTELSDSASNDSYRSEYTPKIVKC